MAKPKQVDWERIEIEYRAGILTLREIADLHQLSHGAINKRAKRDGWERDLNAKIHARAAELVSKQMVSTEVSKEKLDTEEKVIDESASTIANVIRSHVTGISKLQNVCDELTAELVAQSISREELAEIAEIVVMQQTQNGEKPEPKDVQRRLDSFMKLLELGNRADTFKKLVESKTKLIALERTAFDLDKGGNKNQSLGEFLESLQ